ncbi:MAG: hypothetical protein ACRD16_12220 [Thermoanaerobaculia bacterium]
MRPGAWRLGFSVLLAAALTGPVPADASTLPPEVQSFARYLPEYFSKLENILATETTTETLLNDTNGNGTVLRKRVLVSDYQIAHLGENPAALWEFRFVRSVDGQTLPDADRKIEDFFRLRHPSAAAERRSIVELASNESLPGCYWHNLTLVLLAFGDGPNENFDWTPKDGGFQFRQVRGLGIPEDLFNPKSPRHYPSGSVNLYPDGHSPQRIELEFRTDVRRIRIHFEFSPPGPPDFVALPLSYEVDGDRVTMMGFNPESRVRFQYSNIRRFSVSTEEALPPATK